MSLITQCPACSTMFRVVPDQLRISEGWVRCGHCDEVFDANAHLQTLAESAPRVPAETSAGYDWSAVLAPPAAAAPAPAPIVAHNHGVADRQDDFDPLQPHEPFLDEPLLVDGPRVLGHPPETDAFLEQSPHGVPAEALSKPLGAEDAETEAEGAWVQAMETALAQSDAQAEPLAQVTPEQATLSFMPQSSNLKASRRWPGKKTMAVLCLLLALLLVAQGMVLERDRIAVQVPVLRPLLLAGCELLSCAIHAPQQIDAMAIESSAFTSLKPGVYMLSVSLKNAAPIALAAPALELTLTDMQDQTLVRRVLLAKDFSGKPEIAAGSELSANVPISVQQGVDKQRVAGYKLLAFYP